ncbi:vacuolar cation/proton exchanger 1c isoform X1 [Oryza sativa Japonica Group]|uniref:vacuolar cation/proton exchanger 1c isoform X1 n=1 Tax=Oryza sativa subsp. japonica TaxID=39947 RepID=UPI0007753B39|nr:vacuolar cation/proton exchanger 1c isoform X2 [Oryza sativa Japonica Group]
MAPPESSHHHLLESGLLEVSKAPSAAVAAEEEEKKEAAAWTPSSSSSMTGRKIKSEASPLLRRLLGGPAAQLQEVLLGTKLYPLFSAVPLAVAAESLRLGRVWVFAFSLIGLAPLAERVSFLSEHIANTVGPTAGGIMNATCGNVPELIIALFALHKNKMEILKWSLLGSILSNLLLVLGSSLLFGGIVNIGKERPLDKDSSDSSSSEDDATDKSVIGFASAMVWLIGMAVVTAMLSSYVVTTIEEASESMGIPVRFISIILLPIVGNAAEHAGAIIFAFKNKIDISLGITLGSATQISMLVVPVILIVSWVNAIPMDLDFNLLETGSLAMAVITTAFTLQDDKWHYLKGLNLVFSYIVIAVCFFVMKALPTLKKEDD